MGPSTTKATCGHGHPTCKACLTNLIKTRCERTNEEISTEEKEAEAICLPCPAHSGCTSRPQNLQQREGHPADGHALRPQ